MEKTAAVKKASAHIKKLRDDLEVDRQKGGTKQAKLENDIRNAIEAKKKTIDEADKKLQEFIAVKEKYNDFKVRRLKHAYASLGSAIAEIEKAKSDAYEQLRNACIVSNEELEGLLNTTSTEAPAQAPSQEQAGGSPFE
ncbi:hypothetical protein TVAG_050400 [Trichomonas vaginalis G3]|uniref:Uncharacterized protein n=1 Tax=Trichomonas vaginalis (strain ATCC PRA-98 / G3) TaxID=412133 RepID=A2EJG7_TRIV3|nr:hypothetical protein TVAGG3_0389780 [Trichomonas vaginalis G3]EAY07224.1 hypothetical protein TVAG_050400 [Trichomonas vaginalis G3]KAI5533912.1 hypothetical protein TVAGG3_0389780 [Trichomonas vaginalis G3]|eukprot:XP_001319447.1 hypothetical protein [Trichomonas vaginalis G3]